MSRTQIFASPDGFDLTPEGVRVLKTFGTPVEELRTRLEVPLVFDAR